MAVYSNIDYTVITNECRMFPLMVKYCFDMRA